MPYLIDGHNLIPVVPGLRLTDPDDEAKLIGLLRDFCTRTRSRATVFFDRGLLGPGSLSGGAGVSVRFVRPPRTADEAIIAQLANLKGEARNWTVVSSDGEIQRAARRAGARSLSSRAFASTLASLASRPLESKPEAPSNKEEVAYWERRFRERRKPR
jgi:predicted RNA-binding protein with PIN domain